MTHFRALRPVASLTLIALVAVSAVPRIAAASAPSAPTPVTASSITASNITLSWPGVAGASKYVVNRWMSTCNSGAADVTWVSGTTHTTGALNPSTTYCFTVKSMNSMGESSLWPTTVSFTTNASAPAPAPTPTTAPTTAPAPLLDAPRVYAETVPGTTKAKLSWIQMSSTVTAWKVETSLDASVPATTATTTQTYPASSTTTTTRNGYVWTELVVPTQKPATQHYFRMTPVVGTTPQKPAAVVNVFSLIAAPSPVTGTAKLTSTSTGTITLSWPALAGATKYLVYRYSSSTFTTRMDSAPTATTTASVSFNGQPSKYTGYYKVAAYNGAEGPMSAGVTVQVP